MRKLKSKEYCHNCGKTSSKKVMDAICSDHHKSKDGIFLILDIAEKRRQRVILTWMQLKNFYIEFDVRMINFFLGMLKIG